MKRMIQAGKTDYSVLVFIPDSAQTDGSGKTGLVAANLTISGVRMETDNDATVIDYTSSLNNLAALTTAHTDWGLIEISSTLAPGLYRLDIADAIFASGAWTAVVYVMVTTSAAAPSPMEFVLVTHDPDDLGTKQTGDNFAIVNSGTHGNAALKTLIDTLDDLVDTEVAAIKTKTDFLPSATAGAAGGVFIAGTNAATTITTALTTTFTGNLTGNVGGNVTGSVGSVATGGIAAASFATGAIDAAAIADGAIDAATFAASAITATAIAADAITAAKIADGAIDANTFATGAITASAIAADAITDAKVASDVTIASVTGNVGGNVVGSVASVTGLTASDVGAIKVVTDKVNTTLESVGSPTDYVFTAAALAQAPSGSGASAATIADAVWDELLSGHVGVGSAGAALSAAGSAGDPWSTPLPGAYSSGTAGKIVGDNVNATISSRATQTSVDDLPTNAELATALGTADDAVLAQVALVKAKTDNLPSDPADASDIATAFGTVNTTLSGLATSSALSTVSGLVIAVKTVTDLLNMMIEIGAGSPTYYRFKEGALEEAPSAGGGGPTAADIADAVWDEALAGHLSAGSTGDQLNNAAAAGNPWAAIIEGAYTAEDILRILAAVAAGKSSVVTLGNGQALVTFRSLDDGEDMVTSSMNQSARTAVTLGV